MESNAHGLRTSLASENAPDRGSGLVEEGCFIYDSASVVECQGRVDSSHGANSGEKT